MCFRFLSLWFLAVISPVSPLPAQMQTGEQMSRFGEVFGVKTNQRTYPFAAALVESSAPGNILFPGEQVKLTLQIVNNEDRPLSAKGRVRVIAYGTQGIPGDIWLPVVHRAEPGEGETLPIQVEAGPKGFVDIVVAPHIPERFGGYALVVEIDGKGARFATSLVRTFKATNERIHYPKMSLDHLPDDVLNRLGVQAIRYGLSYVDRDQPGRAAWLKNLREELAALHKSNITVLMMIGEGGAPQPLGRARPHLDEKGVMLKTKSDYAWLPSVDPEFQQDVTDICTEFGWPKGPVTAVSLWNEPWEGISISGWGADMLRYREIFTAMAHGVEAARKNGADVLLAGADSSSNTMDKFFSDGSGTFLKWLDVCTVHYQGLDTPVLNKAWINRPGGRVRVWDTESWVANTDDRVPVALAGFRAAGYDRSMGIFGGNIAQPVAAKRLLSGGKSEAVNTVITWSVAAAIGAAQHFIGERDFREILFQKGLPWIFVFNGLANLSDDGTVVICGDLGEAFGAGKLPFRTARGLNELDEKTALARELAALPVSAPAAQRAALQKKLSEPGILAGGSLSLPAADGVQLYDAYGNPVPPAAVGRITVPLDNRGFYLRADGSPGSFERLLTALRTARIEGYEPLAPVVRDPVAPLDQGGVIHVSLSNILNRPVSGTLRLDVAGLALDYPKELSFSAHETREIAVRVAGGASRPDNSYPLTLAFDAGADGHVRHEETIHVNLAARRAIVVDGDLKDWGGVLPQSVRADGDSGPTLTEAAWLPFEKYPATSKSGLATAWLAYDDENFYFAARIADDTPDAGTYRFASIDEDQFFYPEVSYELDPAKTLQKKEETWDVASRKAAALRKPGAGPGDRSYAVWNSTAEAFAMDLKLPPDRSTQVAFYFVDTDPYEAGRRRTLVQVTDRQSGKVLAQQRVEKYGFGTYAVFAVAGDVRVVFRTQSWLPASLSGVFFDSSAANLPGTGARAKFLRLDDVTGADWGKGYGKDGHWVFGTPPSHPAYAQVAVPEEAVLKEYHWPEGVRRYSYRKRPVLPSGNAPKFDNVQIAFGVRAPGEGSMITNLPGVMPGFVVAENTDYEYALNKVSDAFGGGTEIWRLQAPGLARKSFYPRQPMSPLDGAVAGGKLVVRHEGNTRIVEASLPWSELPLVRQAIKDGKPVRFSFRVNDNQGPGMELAAGRSVSKKSSLAFHADWVEHWSNQLEFGFEKAGQ